MIFWSSSLTLTFLHLPIIHYLQLKALIIKYEKLRAAPANSPQWRELDDEVQEECDSLKYMINELDKAIDNAERNPQRFRLSQAEISERRKWIMSTRRQVEGISDGTLPPRQSAAPAQTPTTAAAKLAAAVQDENEGFIRSEGDRQQMMMAHQDEELDVLSHHVVRIGELGREMGQELDSQGQLLDELGVEMEGTQTRLAAAQKKVQYVLEKAGSKGQFIIILILIVVLVVLVFLAIA